MAAIARGRKRSSPAATQHLRTSPRPEQQYCEMQRGERARTLVTETMERSGIGAIVPLGSLFARVTIAVTAQRPRRRRNIWGKKSMRKTCRQKGSTPCATPRQPRQGRRVGHRRRAARKYFTRQVLFRAEGGFGFCDVVSAGHERPVYDNTMLTGWQKGPDAWPGLISAHIAPSRGRRLPFFFSATSS